MAWLELSIRLNRREWPRVEAALEEVGALSVTLLDAEDAPILEPGPGETPLWPEVIANALFDAGVDQRGLLLALQDLVPALPPERMNFRTVEDSDWVRAWMDQYQPMRFGARLWIYPSTLEPPTDPALVVVRLDPGLAFGTGTHPTTALCLQWLDALADRGLLQGKRVLDYGCGSGVLAIAALKLGAAEAIGVDNDPQALTASRDNAERNAVATRLVLRTPDEFTAAALQADIVVANILAGALTALAPVLIAAGKPQAPLALSGILPEQAGDVAHTYAALGRPLESATQDGWVRLATAV